MLYCDSVFIELSLYTHLSHDGPLHQRWQCAINRLLHCVLSPKLGKQLVMIVLLDKLNISTFQPSPK